MTTSSGAPFNVKLLGDTPTANIASLLPAATRLADDSIQVPSVASAGLDFLAKDLLVERLNNVHKYLWLAGRPMPPRHLSHQIVLLRDIIVTENISLHLVWQAKRIFIKPLPKYLLDEGLWTQCLSRVLQDDAEVARHRENVTECARGFLLTYCALVCYESDFKLAQKLGLLPAEIVWDKWRSWVAEIITNCPHERINQRFWYGELRLGRLNKIYRWIGGHVLRGYSTVGSYNDYGELLRENFAAFAIALGYVVIVLTGMQVGLATNHLQQSVAFQGASWIFAVISIIAPLAAVAAILLYLLVMVVTNWRATVRYEKERSSVIGVQIRRHIPSTAKNGGIRV